MSPSPTAAKGLAVAPAAPPGAPSATLLLALAPPQVPPLLPAVRAAVLTELGMLMLVADGREPESGGPLTCPLLLPSDGKEWGLIENDEAREKSSWGRRS